MSQIAESFKEGQDLEGIQIVYDGECPFCSRYVALMRLRDSVGKVELIDAREDHPVVRDISALGLDLNEGMVAIVGSRYYHGAECVHLLSLLTTPSGPFNRLNSWVFRSEWRSRLLYPVLRGCRNLTLRLLGREKLPA